MVQYCTEAMDLELRPFRGCGIIILGLLDDIPITLFSGVWRMAHGMWDEVYFMGFTGNLS